MTPKVLLVDDDKDIAISLGSYLQESGFTVITASDGLDAVNKRFSVRSFLEIRGAVSLFVMSSSC